MQTCIIGFLGTTLDKGFNDNRWLRWRPTISLGLHDDLQPDRIYLLHDRTAARLYRRIAEDLQTVSPQTEVIPQLVSIRNAWDFAEVYEVLLAYCTDFDFAEDTRYLLHLTTGTHVAQICWFLLIQAGYLPAQILQTSPVAKAQHDVRGAYQIIDLDLSRYDRLTAGLEARLEQNWRTLKANIATANPAYNRMICELETVAQRSDAPILLLGATGAGKSQLARQLYQLKRDSHRLSGSMVEINCATLRGDTVGSTLFGHAKGAFTGAVAARDGLLKQADGGLLFLDEIGELGADEQAMLLTVLEDTHYYPIGSDKPVRTRFQLIAGTNRDLATAVRRGDFREDLYARLNTWTFRLPALKDRLEDLPANIDFELARLSHLNRCNYRFNADARRAYLHFATGSDALWCGNFRDLAASMTRLTTLAERQRITCTDVEAEINRLRRLWKQEETTVQTDDALLRSLLSVEQLSNLDTFERIQLAGVIRECRRYPNAAAAGRALFSCSRRQLKTPNDSDRLRKYLAKYGLNFADVLVGYRS